MIVTTQKITLVAKLAQLKWAEMTGNYEMQQSLHEQIVGVHIRMSIAREQAMNKQLFSTI